MRCSATGKFAPKFQAGQVFGNLKLVKCIGKNKFGYMLWSASCLCGKKCIVHSQILRKKTPISCGCNSKLGRKRIYPDPSINTLWHHTKNQAIKRNIQFAISRDFFYKIIFDNCTYCGSKPFQISKATTAINPIISNGIDRIDSSLGYEPKNCVPCCKFCNFAKGEMSVDDFAVWVRLIHSNLMLTGWRKQSGDFCGPQF